MRFRLAGALVTSALLLFSCSKQLEENVYSELDPNNYLTSQEGLSTVLTSSYASTQMKLLIFASRLHTDMFMTGEAKGVGGSWEGSVAGFFQSWTWNTTRFNFSDTWTNAYNAILFSNIVLENVDNPDFDPDFVSSVKGQAYALRAYNEFVIHDWFGPGVIQTESAPAELNAPRASEEAFRAQIEADFQAAIELLSTSPQNGEYGRFTKGGAMGVLCKFYLNTLQWQKAADMAQQIIDLGVYNLQPNYYDVFSLANEGNSEILWVHPADATPQRVANNIVALTLPPNYKLKYPNQASFAARIYYPDAFVNKFELNDERRQMFLGSFLATNGTTVVGEGKNQWLCVKYEEDPNANGGEAGNDFPEIRYADILLSRAEALNEIAGPTQEVVDLINMIRNRAKATAINLGDYDQAGLRDFLLEERQREFFYEAKRRQDLRRHDRLISDAVSRGINAQNFQDLYPIPQIEMDANPNMVQNQGY